MNTTESSNLFDNSARSMPSNAPATDLSDFDDAYAKAEVFEPDEVPDGKYQVRVHDVKIVRSQKGDPMIKFDLLIISGQHAKRHLFKNSVITTASLPFVKADLQMLGLRMKKLSDLANHLDALLDLSLEITKQTRGEFVNVYFNRLLNISEIRDENGSSDQDIPF